MSDTITEIPIKQQEILSSSERHERAGKLFADIVSSHTKDNPPGNFNRFQKRIPDETIGMIDELTSLVTPNELGTIVTEGIGEQITVHSKNYTITANISSTSPRKDELRIAELSFLPPKKIQENPQTEDAYNNLMNLAKRFLRMNTRKDGFDNPLGDNRRSLWLQGVLDTAYVIEQRGWLKEPGWTNEILAQWKINRLDKGNWEDIEEAAEYATSLPQSSGTSFLLGAANKFQRGVQTGKVDSITFACVDFINTSHRESLFSSDLGK